MFWHRIIIWCCVSRQLLCNIHAAYIQHVVQILSDPIYKLGLDSLLLDEFIYIHIPWAIIYIRKVSILKPINFNLLSR